MKRTVLMAIGALGLAAVVVLGIVQARGSTDDGGPAAKTKPPTGAQARRALSGSPPELAALHRQAGELLPGGRPAFEARLRSLQGRPVVVNAWASWCGPCRFELPAFRAASLRLGRRVAFLGVDHKDAPAAARALSRKLAISYPSYEDPTGRIASSFGVQGLPFTVFYSRSGRRELVHQGPYASEGALLEAIRRYAR